MDDEPKFPPDDLKVDFGRVLKEASDPKRLADLRAQGDERRKREVEERERERFAAAVKRFVPYGSSLPGAWVCPTCGALVSIRENHVRWHDGVNEAAAAAHDASWRMRPIG